LITKGGRPVAKLVPAEEVPREFLGRLEGIVKIIGDIESPIEPPIRGMRCNDLISLESLFPRHFRICRAGQLLEDRTLGSPGPFLAPLLKGRTFGDRFSGRFSFLGRPAFCCGKFISRDGRIAPARSIQDTKRFFSI
jgi:hypothetical protein